MDEDRHASVVVEISGINELWAETLGDPRICIGILDGPVDQSHPSLAAANLTRLETLVSGITDQGPALRHGTHVASVIFGGNDGPIKGIAPRCRGLIVPVFKDGDNGSIAPCSQVDLARAISLAVQEGAQIINISGGEFSPSGEAEPLLADTVRNCARNGVLIVAAAGNQGCDCLHIPGALPSVLAVGAMNSQGMPLEYSNWGEKYQTQGILAPGEGILGATPSGGTVTNSGTSYATPITSGITALLLSLQLKRGQEPKPHVIRAAILSSAVGCDDQPAPDCRRILAGRLNVKGAMSQVIQKGGNTMSDSMERQANAQPEVTESADSITLPIETPTTDVQVVASDSTVPEISEDAAQSSAASTSKFRESKEPVERGAVDPSSVKASECGCGGGAPPQLVSAIGQLGFDFGTEARRDSIMQNMDPPNPDRPEIPPNPHDPVQLLMYLEENPWDAAAIIWTLNLDVTPIYAIQAKGSFEQDIYQRLREFLGEQLSGEVERVSIPGYISGSARLFTGQVVPIIWPELRGMFSWNTTALVEAVCGPHPEEKASRKARDGYDEKKQAVENFLVRVYDELRNLGSTPQERAVNYAATNALNVAQVFKEAIQAGLALDTIEVERSPISRPNSDCWDVKLTFFNPSEVFEQARKVYRFTVDVSDVVPVMVGPVRAWFVR